MQEPKAMDPKWYLKIHLIPVATEPFPPSSLVCEKYQVQQAAAMMN